VNNWKNSQNSVRKKSFGGTFSFSNCHIIGLDNGSLVLIVFVQIQILKNGGKSFQITADFNLLYLIVKTGKYKSFHDPAESISRSTFVDRLLTRACRSTVTIEQ
jgi:hypothetical protein